MKDTIDIITGKAYLTAVCQLNSHKTIASICTTGLITVFGADHTGILILMILWVIDTITGVLHAIIQKQYKSSIGFMKGGVKLYVIGTTFVTMSLLATYHPELQILPNLIASFFIFNEAYSIIENLNRLRPNPLLKAILLAIGSAETKITESFNKLK